MVDNVNNTNEIDYTKLGLTNNSTTKTKSPNELGQEDFLKLITAQMNNQDPLNPQDGKDFIAQLANFSMNDGIQKLQQSFSELSSSLQSSQALQASALVGRSVYVPSKENLLTSTQPLNGTVKFTVPTKEVTLNIFDANGELQRHIKLDDQTAGDVEFSWNGIKDDGTTAAPGMYTVKVQGLVDGKSTEMEISMATNVDSVTLDKEKGLLLNLAGIGAVGLDKVQKIAQ